MNFHELFSIIIIPCSLLSFAFDYLSDKDVTENETKIGFFSFLHHLIITIQGTVLLNLCISNNLALLVLTCLITTIGQMGWLINKDHCFITRFVNLLIGPDKKYRKWRGGIEMYIKHYIRGDEWAYADFTNYRNKGLVLFGNIALIIWCVKIIITNEWKF
jgi:hypothetical protein